MLTVNRASKNIERIATEASDVQWLQGCAWYNNAHNYCLSLSLEFHRSMPSVVGVLAVLSPQCAWETNKLATRDMLERGTTERQCYPVNIAKARRILEGETFLEVSNHSRYGKKVRAFYDNILHTESKLVTVDTHAIRAAFDRATLPLNAIRWVFEGRGNSIIQEAYCKTADKFKIAPYKLQAVVWLRVKQSLED